VYLFGSKVTVYMGHQALVSSFIISYLKSDEGYTCKKVFVTVTVLTQCVIETQTQKCEQGSRYSVLGTGFRGVTDGNCRGGTYNG